MSKNIKFMGANYNNVPGVELPLQTSGTAIFYDVSDTTRAAADVAQGKYFYTSQGVRTRGTSSGGGTSKNVQIASGVGRVNANTYTAVSGQTLTVAKTGKYDVYWCGYRSSTSGTSGSQLYIDGTAYGSANTTFNSTYTNCQNVHLSNVSLTEDEVIVVRARSRSSSYYMYVFNLTIIEV